MIKIILIILAIGFIIWLISILWNFILIAIGLYIIWFIFKYFNNKNNKILFKTKVYRNKEKNTLTNNILNFKNNSNEDLALSLLESLSMGATQNSIKINQILKSCNSRQEILNKVIELCGEPDTPKKRYIYAKAYGWSNKEYRKKAINYITLYLNNPLFEDIYINRFKNINDNIEQRKQKHISDMKEMLADIYAKEYELKKALDIYNELIEIEPYMPMFYRKKINIMIKLNNLDDCINYLNNIKKSKYYKLNFKYQPNDWMIKTIDELLYDCISKKQNNYIYKPRKKLQKGSL